jgi:hypothetical protein
MKKYIIYFALIATSCNSGLDRSDKINMNDEKKIPDIQLPFKIRCDNFPGVHDSINFPNFPPKDSPKDIAIYYGKILKGDLTILIKNRNKIQSPILYTVGKNGRTIDSLVLFDRPCYIGTDSHYLPWIEITKDLKVIRTDTSYYSGFNNTFNSLTKENELRISTDSTVTTDIFIIDNFGKITWTK